MISIGVLGNGAKAADYYLGRQAGCEMEYYTGAGERRGEWIGRGATALGGRCLSPRGGPPRSVIVSGESL